MLNKSGNALILILTMTTFLMLILTLFWKKSSLVLDLTSTRQEYYQNLYLTKTALNLAIKIVSQNFDLFFNNSNDISLDFSFLADSSEQNINIIIYKNLINNEKNDDNEKINDKKIYLSAFLYEKNNLLCKLACCLCLDENLIQQGGESVFMVDAFTIGNFI